MGANGWVAVFYCGCILSGYIPDGSVMYFAKLSIPGKQNSELSYVFADSLSEQQNGSVLLFGLFDVKSTSELYHTIIKQAVKHFLDFYHTASPFDAVASEDLPDSTEFIFEHSVQYTYEKVSDALRDIQERSSHRQSVDLKKINCVLGAVLNGTLYLSVTGTSIKPMLVYPVVHRNGPVQYMLVNIIESGGDQSADAHARLFSQLVSGPLTVPSSSIMLCNQTFLDYISPQQIKQTISNSKIQSIIPYFEHLLSRVNARSDFSALLISPDSAPSPTGHQNRATAAPASSSSMHGLNGTAESTRSILTPTMRPILSRSVRGILMFIVLCARTLLDWAHAAYATLMSPAQKHRYRAVLESVRRSGKTLIHTSSRTSASYASRLMRIASSFRERNMRERFQTATAQIVAQGTTFYAKTKQWFYSLNTLSRSLFILSILFIFLFIISLLSIQLKNTSEQKQSRITEILAAVEQKQIAADASLIYDDKARARDLLSESKNLLALVDERSIEREDYKKMKQALETLEMKIYNITRIDEPMVLASIPPTPAVENASPLRLTAADATIIAYTSNALYRYDREKKEFIDMPMRDTISSRPCARAVSEKQVLFCTGTADRITAISFPDQTTQSYSLGGAPKGAPTSLFVYNNRLYTFSSATGELYRFAKNGDSFTNGISWLRDPSVVEQLKGARDSALDGLVYILTADGTLTVFRSGRRSDVTIPDDTASLLRSATRIITDEQLNYLYALLPGDKKIIVIDKKTYSIAAQITSPALQNPNDFAVSKKRKAILVLDRGTLFSIPFEVK